MSNNIVSKNPHSENYGLPARPTTASNPVWQHLLHPKDRTPTSLADIAAVAPPVGPLDKNATSMRILLHDTQSNFEKFGKHVGQLFEEIKDCKLEMKTMHSLFERDREGLMGDIIDLVNRSQKECQKSIGSPAQCQPIETFFKNVEHHLAGIGHKLDAIQSSNQTHTQALQTQIQAVQLLLDKQASIIAVVSPLLPLLQALPLHIDTIKASLNDAFERYTTALKELCGLSNSRGSDSTATTGLSTTVKRTSKRKWPGVDQSPSASSTTPTSDSPLHKKSRKEETSKSVVESMNEHFPKQRLDDTSLSPRNSSAAAGPGVIAAQIIPRKNDNETFPTVGPGVSPSETISSRKQGRMSAVPNFATPRRPLTDLPVLSCSGSSPGQRNKYLLQRHPTREGSSGRSNTLAGVFPSANLRRSAPTPVQPPRILRAHPSLSNCSKDSYATVNSLENSRTYVASSSGQGLLPSNLPGLPQNLSIKRAMVDFPPVAENSISGPPTMASAGFEFLPAKPKANFARQKDRRSPIRDGRRFIPLVDSDDEEELMA